MVTIEETGVSHVPGVSELSALLSRAQYLTCLLPTLMDKFATLEPVRLYTSAASTAFFSKKDTTVLIPTIGRLPVDLHLIIFAHIPIPDIPAYSRCSRGIALISRDEITWKSKWEALGVDKHGFSFVLEELEAKSRGQVAASIAGAPPTIPAESIDDDFGDFASVNTSASRPDEMAGFVGAFNGVSLSMPRALSTSRPTFRSMYQRAHSLLKLCIKSLTSPPHIVLTSLSALVSSSPRTQAKILHLLSLFLSETIQPLRSWQVLYSSLRSTVDRFDANLLTAFDLADSKNDEIGMREAAEASWEVCESEGRDWEMGKVWAEKREIFYEQGRWGPLDNFTCVPKMIQVSRLKFNGMQNWWCIGFRCNGQVYGPYLILPPRTWLTRRPCLSALLESPSCFCRPCRNRRRMCPHNILSPYSIIISSWVLDR